MTWLFVNIKVKTSLLYLNLYYKSATKLTNQYVSHGFSVLVSVVWTTTPGMITCGVVATSQAYERVGCITVIFLVCQKTQSNTSLFVNVHIKSLSIAMTL